MKSLFFQAKKYIADTMGEKYSEGIILDMEKMWQESNCRSPLVCLLSMGSDPTPLIEGLAKKLRLGKHLIDIFLFFKMTYRI